MHSSREVDCWESSGCVVSTLFLCLLGSEVEVVGASSSSSLLRLLPQRVGTPVGPAARREIEVSGSLLARSTDALGPFTATVCKFEGRQEEGWAYDAIREDVKG